MRAPPKGNMSATNPPVTVITPIVPEHGPLVGNALSSVTAQTVYTLRSWAYDENRVGPAIIRNQLAAKVTTPFIVFLDADDTLEPTFIEECLRAYRQGHYVYTGWQAQSVHRPDPCGLMSEGGFIVTSLIPTAAFRYIGGFNEALQWNEDGDLFARLMLAGVCGIPVDKPLVNYSNAGIRSKQFHQRADWRDIVKQTYQQYGGIEYIMAKCGSCGGGQPAPIVSPEPQPGDVQARAMWRGIRTVVGHATMRSYRGGNDSIIPVALADVEAMPNQFQRVLTAAELTPPEDDILVLAGLK